MMEFARQLLDAVPVTVFTVDLDGIVTGGKLTDFAGKSQEALPT